MKTRLKSSKLISLSVCGFIKGGTYNRDEPFPQAKSAQITKAEMECEKKP
ncbi:hypothetical protein ACFOEE_17040 [Pseudoalteromonas fenneropenaei]|uniref:Lipoprotein n=1 Tax=Pseudoalteromonas fenneropenaei TaxID=1737459 RepID=A0ABV7CNJ2_9GAMM